MSLRVVTVPYRPDLGRFDDAELRNLTERGNLASHHHHLVDAAGEPKLVFVLELRAVAERAGTGAARRTAAPSPVEPEPGGTERPPRSTRTPVPRTPDGALDLQALGPAGRETFEALRRWRYREAQEQGVPPFVILTNRHLLELVEKRPGSRTELERIHGIGRGKVERYGAALIELLAPGGAGSAGERDPLGEEAPPPGEADRADETEVEAERHAPADPVTA